MAELLAREFDLLCKITKCSQIVPITTLAYYISVVLIFAQFCQSIQGCGFCKILKLLEHTTEHAAPEMVKLSKISIGQVQN